MISKQARREGADTLVNVSSCVFNSTTQIYEIVQTRRVYSHER